MDESILTSVKQMLGIVPEYTAFDPQIIMDINSALSILHQLGVGDGYFIVTGTNEKWDDLIPDPRFAFVKTWLYMKVRLMFDPPASSYAVESMEKQIAELEWRINSEIEVGDLTD